MVAAPAVAAPQSSSDEPLPFHEIGADEGEETATHESGMRFGLGVVGARSFGALGRAVASGLGGRSWLGYEAIVGSVGLVPRLSIEYIRFLEGESQPSGVFESTNASTLTVFPGMALTVKMPVRPWVGFGFGYGRVSVEQSSGGLEASSNETGFGVGFQGGVEFRVGEAAMLGLTSDYTLVFNDIENRSWMTFGLSGTFFL